MEDLIAARLDVFKRRLHAIIRARRNETARCTPD